MIVYNIAPILNDHVYAHVGMCMYMYDNNIQISLCSVLTTDQQQWKNSTDYQ